MSLPFKFKEFTVAHDRCAMKIGTDGVLLGAWVSLEHEPDFILDLGTGTGLIALQLAQRSTANTIDAVEIDANAFEQCIENFENSPWGDRLFCYHASAQEFAAEIDETYDLIISNPPFYQEDYKSKTEARDLARFNEALPFNQLIGCVHALLADSGIFALILPFKEELSFIKMASEAGLFPKRICRVRGTFSSKTVRSLVEFSFRRTTPNEEELVIENSRHDYTEEYVNLVQDFYLKM
jgi:tRNA1Val (adenine37-N6)-methyltransferase